MITGISLVMHNPRVSGAIIADWNSCLSVFLTIKPVEVKCDTPKVGEICTLLRRRMIIKCVFNARCREVRPKRTKTGFKWQHFFSCNTQPPIINYSCPQENPRTGIAHLAECYLRIFETRPQQPNASSLSPRAWAKKASTTLYRSLRQGSNPLCKRQGQRKQFFGHPPQFICIKSFSQEKMFKKQSTNVARKYTYTGWWPHKCPQHHVLVLFLSWAEKQTRKRFHRKLQRFFLCSLVVRSVDRIERHAVGCKPI